ncbi:putative Uridine/cytidine kinase [Stachybotrys elegans]|uniref:Uridine/cytidine kinase n=1 Tax=Stachybotrys elegans TaxID=80388 RepID=A0A8K0SXS9_9HYPO|nr:putative Uridine/cytidine kinase [Stachybotrys elegans]
MASFIDDKTPLCIPFILERLRLHQARSDSRPFVVGLNGIQGAGKTTLVRALSQTLESHDIPTLVCSIDDFYLTHEDQVALAQAHADNALLQHRGEPGTHDVPLAVRFIDDVMNRRPTKLPQYDKAAFGGQGDRLPESQWKPVNQPGQPLVQAVILEGWSVGFRPLATDALAARREAPSRTLNKHPPEHLLLINDKLRQYDALTDLFDAFIHIDAQDLEYVYGWRQQQEEHLRIEKGDPNAGMTPDQVVHFVDGYFPAYELFTDGVRQGIFKDRPGAQLRMVVGQDRKVKQVVRI